ncbi:hypothetical protein C3Z09_22250 [Lelliottia aquatilis]|uniref:hypothetical protein n=1 Tax=Lelliottia aquatilis TaxID=2080838 RepID=UPI000CDE8DA1|nr:hypothetical protein [Lelliottia aquatilis]POZ13663.1 hypothetical protein C3Z09_22250 [Lelliottia aquatilis]
MKPTNEELEARYEELVAELCTVDVVLSQVTLIDDEQYELCPAEVQTFIRKASVLQIPAYKNFLSEVRTQARNEGINFAASRLAAAFNHGFIDKAQAEVFDVVRMILTAKEDLENDPLPAADGLSGEYAEQALKDWAEELSQEVSK